MWDNSMKKILILGIDTFEPKNIPQLNVMNKKGYSFIVLTNDNRGTSDRDFQNLLESNKLIIARENIFSRLLQVLNVFKENKFSHVELYPAGRMAISYIFICKIFNVKLITVERGDIGFLYIHSLFVRLSIILAYKISDIVWYKEPYMKELLLKHIKKNKLVFLPNSAPDKVAMKTSSRDIDFLWVNRLIKERRSDWLVECLKVQELKFTNTTILGFQKNADPATIERQEFIKNTISNENITLLEFEKPNNYYIKAKFFILPTTIVFGNNSLLESMAVGVVPIVSETTSTNLIVRDGENGIVFPHDKVGLKEALIRAANMDEAEWLRLSNNAKETITKNYSQKIWGNICYEMYNSL
jgi:glycosyltransferase involved in cell wall biosynthesis